MGDAFSLHEARIIACMAITDKNLADLPDVPKKLMFTLLRESSHPEDIVLAYFVDTKTSSFVLGDVKWDHITKDILDMIQSRPNEFNFSYISFITTSIRRHTIKCWGAANDCQNSHIAMWVAAARIFTTFLRYKSLCVTELAFVLAQLQMICTTRDARNDSRRLWRHQLLDTFMDRPVNHESSDKPFLPYLHHGYTLMKAILLLDSFPEFIRFLHDRPHSPAAFRAFAIQFLICLYDKSKALYERVVDQISSQEVQEWASEALGGQERYLSCVILHKLGLLEGLSHLSDAEFWQEAIKRYDQSLDPLTLDLSRPLVHALYHVIPSVGINMGSLTLGNIWLALHAQTAVRFLRLPIPAEKIQWVDHPISEMIALKRLESFGGYEDTFLILFFHSSSFDILLRALKEYVPNLLIRCTYLNYFGKGKTLPDGFPASLSNALRILLDPDGPVDHLSSVWTQIYHLSNVIWVRVSNDWQTGFVRIFFCEENGSNGAISRFLGIQWMEAVWQRALKHMHRTREVVIESADLRWAGFERDPGEPNLDQSGTKLLSVLATFLETAALSGFVTVGLAAAISTSHLYEDDKLRQDLEALDRIEAIIRPLLVPLPETPPTSNVELPSVDDRTADGTQSADLLLRTSAPMYDSV